MERRVLIPSQIKIDQEGILAHLAMGERKKTKKIKQSSVEDCLKLSSQKPSSRGLNISENELHTKILWQ